MWHPNPENPSVLCPHDLHVANPCGSLPTRATLPCYGARARNSRHHKHIDEEQTLKEVLRQADLFQHHERRLEEYKRANARQNNQGDVAHSVMGRLILNVNVSCWQVEIFEKEQAAKRVTDGCRS